MTPIIERARAGDWPDMKAVCVETSARPVPPEDAEAFGAKWLDAYRRWAPEWAYVARAEGRVAGYLTGCPSSWRFTVNKALLGPWVRLGPNRPFSPSLQLELLRSYPAHLHVNVREGFRGGTGRALVERYEADLRAAGVFGNHLFCGAKPVGFYEKVGYRTLAKVEIRGTPVFCLGKRLA